jgi:hypothetical protein
MSGKVGLETSSVENLTDVVGSSLGLADGVAAEVVGALVVPVAGGLVAGALAEPGASGSSSPLHPARARTASASAPHRRDVLIATSRSDVLPARMAARPYTSARAPCGNTNGVGEVESTERKFVAAGLLAGMPSG